VHPPASPSSPTPAPGRRTARRRRRSRGNCSATAARPNRLLQNTLSGCTGTPSRCDSLLLAARFVCRDFNLRCDRMTDHARAHVGRHLMLVGAICLLSALGHPAAATQQLLCAAGSYCATHADCKDQLGPSGSGCLTGARAAVCTSSKMAVHVAELGLHVRACWLLCLVLQAYYLPACAVSVPPLDLTTGCRSQCAAWSAPCPGCSYCCRHACLPARPPVTAATEFGNTSACMPAECCCQWYS
jgi:hypothetical protein